jgi:nitrogen fixation NifU-like protein
MLRRLTSSSSSTGLSMPRLTVGAATAASAGYTSSLVAVAAIDAANAALAARAAQRAFGSAAAVRRAPTASVLGRRSSSAGAACAAATFAVAGVAGPATARRTVYSDKVVDHFNKPRNIGNFDRKDPNVGQATVGAPECGDMAKMQLKINDDTGVIEDTRIKVFGCGSAIASMSYVSELLKGKTLDEALAVTNREIASELSLPPVKLHCSLLAEETIKAAVTNYLQKKPALKSKVRRHNHAEADKPATDAADTSAKH